MKVNLEYESIDADGEKQISRVAAIMDIRLKDYKLSFVEDLSGEGKNTGSTMYLSPESMRIIRKGEVSTDLMFGEHLIHNTNYVTPYGNLPVTVTTKEFNFSVSHLDFRDAKLLKNVDAACDFWIIAYASYDIEMNGVKMPMSMKVRVTL